MQSCKFAFAAVLVLCTAVCMGDSIKVGEDTYGNVYVSERHSAYIVCFPADGTLITVPKRDVPPENLNVVEDRNTRRSLYEKWMARRSERKKHSAISPALWPQSDLKGSAATPPSKEAAPERTKKEETQIANTTDQPDKNDVADSYSSRYSQENDEKLRRQAAVEGRRRQEEAGKERTLANRGVITSEDALNSNALQWGNPMLWNSAVGWGDPVQWNSGVRWGDPVRWNR